MRHRKTGAGQGGAGGGDHREMFDRKEAKKVHIRTLSNWELIVMT